MKPASSVQVLSRLGALPALAFGLFLLLPAQRAGAQSAGGQLRPSDLESLVWRELGPSITSGRVTAFAVHPEDDQIIYAASASGGAWKTENGGTTWLPIFSDRGSASLGAIALDPSDPDVVWLGTGEQNSVRSSSFGDGVYRSRDGGETWTHMGLEGSRHIGRILVHPRNPNIVFVAALGSLWGPNPVRGLYRTTDGGVTWNKVLAISNYTGAVEVRMDPSDPDIMLAATFQRERRQWSMLGGGEESGLYRSEDGGYSWREVRGGFPTSPLGRIGIAFCPGDPDIVYASAVGPEGGLFRSEDGGRTWERRNREIQSHWYYGELVCDPANPDRLYVPMTPLHVSEDGGRTFRNLVETGVHVDHHTLWVNPRDPDHLMVGNDGGIYISRDRGRHWLWQANLPVMQLYTVAVDMQDPFYHVYGGAQDNGSWGGPIGTRFSDGVSNEDWLYTAAGDGFHSQVDPDDPNVIYSESQYGVLYRMDRRTGERKLIQPWQPTGEGRQAFRWNWSAPLLISPHDPHTLYFAANVVFRSRDRGDSWEVVSPDLTRRISRNALPLQGRAQPPDAIDLHASTALYGNISTLAVSPLRPGLVVVGTDDGLVQVTRDDGRSWQRTDRFPGVPGMMKVAMVAWSPVEEGTLVVVFDGHKDNTFRPFVIHSDDFGVTWTNITGDLPEFGPTRSVAFHPRNGNLIFVGTEFGVFFSTQGGRRWMPLGQGLPTVAVHDMEVHPRENDLILGTHGRGFWVLDDLGLLEALTPEVVAGGSYLAQPRRATQIRDVNRGRGSTGDTYWTAGNPPRGAILDFWIGDEGTGEPVNLEILDDTGTLVRHLADTTGVRGAHRVIWDLRHTAPSGPDGRPSRRLDGRFVLPGTYEAQLTVGDSTQSRTFQVRMDPAVAVDPGARRALDETLALQARLAGAAARAGAAVDTVRAQAGRMLQALRASRDVRPGLLERTQELEAEADRLHVILQGPDQEGIAQQETSIPLASLVTRLYRTTESWTGPPTEDQMRLTGHARRELGALLSDLRAILDPELPELRQIMENTGIPWPGGDIPTLPENLLPAFTPGSGNSQGTGDSSGSGAYTGSGASPGSSASQESSASPESGNR